MRISVALCTYNGERYLGEQLASILFQSRKPDELVICDDMSTDRTLEIVREFSRIAPFAVRILENEQRLGSSRNFGKAIEECRGDVIALSDQDDIWVARKLAVIEEFFNRFPDTDMVFSDADIVDQELQPLGFTLWEAMRFSKREWEEVESGHALRVLLRRNVVQGAAMALRSQIRQHVLPVPEDVVHDAWIAVQVAIVGRMRLIRESLVSYRQHGANQIGMQRVDFFERMRTSCERSIAATRSALLLYEQVHQRLQDAGALNTPSALMEDLAGKVEHLRRRLKIGFREHGWLQLLISEVLCGRYHRYSFGWWSIGHELVKCSFPRTTTSRNSRRP